jgi:hypothetical protein
MRIDTSGNVGIGTTAPDAPLSVFAVAAQNIAAHLSSASGAVIQFTDQGSKDWGFGIADGTSALTFFEDRNVSAAGTARMTIASGGNVGIGTTSKQKNLIRPGSLELGSTTQTDLLDRLVSSFKLTLLIQRQLFTKPAKLPTAVVI